MSWIYVVVREQVAEGEKRQNNYESEKDKERNVYLHDKMDREEENIADLIEDLLREC